MVLIDDNTIEQAKELTYHNPGLDVYKHRAKSHILISIALKAQAYIWYIRKIIRLINLELMCFHELSLLKIIIIYLK